MVLNLVEQTVDNVAEQPATLILPFTVSARNRTLPFTAEMEMAATFIVAESDRKKREGLILRRPAEELTFITKLWYPIWLVPWNSQTLVIDALGASTRTIQYEALPDVKTFISEVQGSSQTRQAYSAALSDRLHHFEVMKRIEEKTFLGLMTSPDLLEDLQQFMMEGEKSELSEIREACITPNISESSISSSLSELSDLKTNLEHEIQSLRDAMRLVNNSTKRHVDALREEVREIQADLDGKIAEAKSASMEKISQIQEKYDVRILKTSQRFDKQLQELHQERVKLEKAQDRAVDKIERCDTEIQDSKSRNDSTSERRWKDEKETSKKEASSLRKSLEALDKQIEQTESLKKVEIANVRAEFNAESEEAMKEVRELEAIKESKTQLNQQEIKALENNTSAIIGQIDVLTKRKRSSLDELDRMGVKEHRRKTTLAYVPFYLSCLRADGKHKYIAYSPCVAGSMKTTTKLKGMLGMSRLASLFQPRSKAIGRVLNQVITLVERDPVFEKELYDVGVQTNMLKSAESRERILAGLNDLRNEEWVSANEVQTLSALLKT